MYVSPPIPPTNNGRAMISQDAKDEHTKRRAIKYRGKTIAVQTRCMHAREKPKTEGGISHVAFHPTSYTMHMVHPDPHPFLPRHAVSGSQRRDAPRSGAHGLRRHEIRLADDLVRRALDDAARLGELGADAHEVGVDVAGGLAAFVDAPARR